jgi:hypothetical protein
LLTCKQGSTSSVSAFLHDAKRFTLRFQSVLADAPLQIYCSALMFAPEQSLIRQGFVDQVVQRVNMLSTREADWDACRSTLEGHSTVVTAVAFSSNGQVLHTNAGDISLSPLLIVLSPSRQQEQSSNILVQDQWILHNQQRFLWLPSEYRASRTSVHNNLVCLGLSSGRVVLLKVT